MANSDKSRAALKAHFDSVQKDIDDIRAKTDPLREQRDAIMAKMQPLEDHARELAAKIKEIEQPVLSDLCTELSRLAQAMGGRRMSDGTAEQKQ
jgi:predicted nuclease with TOPRIM domain